MKTNKHNQTKIPNCFAAVTALGFLAATGGQALAQNNASGFKAFIGGGDGNTASGSVSSILGGGNNTASATNSNILGGSGNTVAAQRSGILGGTNNTITSGGVSGAIISGSSNIVSGNSAGVMFGFSNTASGIASVVVTGKDNSVSGTRSVLLGGDRSTLGSDQSLMWASDINLVAGSKGVVYFGDNSRNGTTSTEFWGDDIMIGRFANGLRFFGHPTSNAPNVVFRPDGPTNSMHVGINTQSPNAPLQIVSNATLFSGEAAMRIGSSQSGRHLAFDANEIQAAIRVPTNGNYTSNFEEIFINQHGGNVGIGLVGGSQIINLRGSEVRVNGTLVHSSDRNLKTDFKPLDSKEVLAKIAEMPVTNWRWKSDESGTRHIGPMAQDFKKAFSLNEDDTVIAPLDVDGITLVAIQGLNEMIGEKDAEIDVLKKSHNSLKESNEALNLRLEKLESMIKASSN